MGGNAGEEIAYGVTALSFFIKGFSVGTELKTHIYICGLYFFLTNFMIHWLQKSIGQVG